MGGKSGGRREKLLIEKYQIHLIFSDSGSAINMWIETFIVYVSF